MKPRSSVTSIFMVPTLNIDREKLLENKFFNGYVKDGNRDVQYENCIYLLFKPKDLEIFRNFLSDEYERTKAIIDDYDYSGGFVVLVYELDRKFDKDFKLIRQGKYSKTSKAFQNLFPKTIKIKKGFMEREDVALQHRIFKKSEDVIEYWEQKIGTFLPDGIEVWETFIEEKETLNIDKIKQEWKDF